MLDCRKCGAVIDDPGNTGRCRFCTTPYRANPSAAAPVAASSPTHAIIEVMEIGRNKIAVIKVINTTLKIGLKEAKDISDQPCPFHMSVERSAAQKVLDDLVKAGARARAFG